PPHSFSDNCRKGKVAPAPRGWPLRQRFLLPSGAGWYDGRRPPPFPLRGTPMAKKAPDKDQARLRALIEEATVDCYNEAEEHMGLMNMVEGNVVCPFPAKVIGEEVEVVDLRSPPAGFGLEAVCRYKGKDYRLDVSSLEWPRKKPEGFEWIEAYQA